MTSRDSRPRRSCRTLGSAALVVLAACGDGGGAGADAATAVDAAADARADCRAGARDLPGVERIDQPGGVVFPRFPSQRLGNQRQVTVLVPPGDGPAPVLYAHDGQNLLDPARAAFGQAWELDEAAARLWADGHRFLVVAIDNTAGRIDEYTPVPDPGYGGGGGEAYLDFVLDELKPFIDFHFATACEAADTAMLGSSLGGLISLHAGRTRADQVGRVAAMSPSLWWNDQWTLAQFQQQVAASPIVLWLDAGTAEGTTSSVRTQVRAVRDRALALGHVFGRDLGSYEAERAEHDEASWRDRLDAVLRFLFARDDAPPDLAYAWVDHNPLGVGGGAGDAVMQWVWRDGRRLTPPANLVTWSVEAGPAQVGASGQVVGVGAGTATVRAAAGGLVATTTVEVRADPGAEVELIFSADAPATTPASDVVHLTGSTPSLGTWDGGAIGLLDLGRGRWRTTALVPSGGAVEYKYTRGSWDTVEKAEDGSELPNRGVLADRPRLVRDRIAAWRP